MNFCLKVLEDSGYRIRKDSVIVDLGCGAGKNVRDLRAAGFQAFGCDLDASPHMPYRNSEIADLADKGYIRRITADPYRLPFDDASVDYIFSVTVMEHVANFEETVAELARILKPGGACFHYFPAKYSVIEHHLYIPFAACIQNYPWLYFWALMGYRKYYQKNMGAAARAKQNYELLRDTTFYLSEGELRRGFGKYFPKVSFAEKSYFKVTPSRKSQMLGKISRFIPGVPKLYRTFWANALIAAK